MKGVSKNTTPKKAATVPSVAPKKSENPTPASVSAVNKQIESEVCFCLHVIIFVNNFVLVDRIYLAFQLFLSMVSSV